MEQSKYNKKRSLSSSKKSIHCNKQLKTELLKIYANGNGKKIKTQKTSNKHKINARQKSKSKSKIDTSDYDFPEFSIQFKEDIKSSVYKKSIIEKHQQSKPFKTQRPQSKNKKLNKKYINKNVSLMQISEDCNKKIGQLEEELGKISHKQKHNNLEVQYVNCLVRLFKLLDIYNQGKISQINLNKCVPQPALYFLGKVFQKIRVQKLTVTQQQFIKLCNPLLIESSREDITQFINKTNYHYHLKKSINLSEINTSQLSPIQRRLIEQELLKSSSKQKHQQNNSQLPYVIDMIRNKEAEVQRKLNEINQRKKSVTFKALQQINQNKRQVENSCSKTKQLQKCRIKVSHFNEQQNNLPVKRSILKTSVNYTQEPPVLQKVKMDNIKIQEMRNPYIANFTFQLPQIIEVVSEKESLNGLQSQQKWGNIQKKFNVKLQKSQASQIGQSISARYLSKSIEDLKSEMKSPKNNQNLEENKRLDNLNKRIESFLKMNAQKIQKNKSFFEQNHSKQLLK